MTPEQHIALVIVLGALWRWWDGRGLDMHPGIFERSLPRLALAAPIAAYASWLAQGESWWILWAGGIAVLSMQLSPSKFIDAGWDSWWMGLRFLVPAAAVVAPGGLGYFALDNYGAAYLGVTVLAGLSYPILHRTKWLNGRVAEYGPEAISGGAVLGGLALM